VFWIVQQTHGHVWVDSEPGRGTTFKIYLPRSDAIATRQSVAGPLVRLYGTETVLLVEDDGQVRDVARSVLRRHGYVVIAARDGDEAMHVCQAHPDPIHLLLTDLVMPGITGRELARRLLRIQPGMKVLCMSGYSDAVEDPAGAADTIVHLQKPFTAESLATSVRHVLDGGCHPSRSHG
jgi:CheY-like chemotaxis protein